MKQAALFYDDIYRALEDVIKALGGSKRVGPRLWPEKSPDAAARCLADCLNIARPEKLSLEQVILLLRWGKEEGCHIAMHFLCGEAGYAPPEPIDPEDRKAALQREFIEYAKKMEFLVQQIGSIGVNGK